MVLFCGCSQGPNGVRLGVEYQDAVYGSGNRVHTPMAKTDKDGPTKFRCTVCSKERTNEKKSEKKLAKDKA